MATTKPGASLAAMAVLAGYVILGCAPAPAEPESAGKPTAAPETIVFREASDASAAVALDARTILVADDEDNALRAYTVEGGLPLFQHDLSAFLGTTVEHAEADIEGAARVGDRTYWITSHGRNPTGKWRPNRHRLFATGFRPSAEGGQVVHDGAPYRDLAEHLATDPALAALGLGLAVGVDGADTKGEERRRLAPMDEGLNIEGLCATPDGAALYIGLRNPLGKEGRAIVIPLANPASVIDGTEPPRFAPPLEWNLAGSGIRALVHSSFHAAFFIVAGPTDEAPGFDLYRWSGVPSEQPTLLRRLDDAGPAWQPEALVAFDGSPRLLVLSDDGGVLVPVASPTDCEEELRGGSTCSNKRLRERAKRSFSGRWIEP